MAKKQKQSTRKLLMVGPNAPFQFNEAYKSLRTNLEFLSATSDYKVILITSSMPEEGKSNVAINLAQTLAANGKRVILVDGDPAAAQIICEKITQVCPDLIKDAVEAGSVKLISAASTPLRPVSPNTLKNTAIGAMVGLVLCVGVLVLRMLLNNKINSDADVQKYLDLPVLGVIPAYEGDK